MFHFVEDSDTTLVNWPETRKRRRGRETEPSTVRSEPEPMRSQLASALEKTRRYELEQHHFQEMVLKGMKDMHYQLRCIRDLCQSFAIMDSQSVEV